MRVRLVLVENMWTPSLDTGIKSSPLRVVVHSPSKFNSLTEHGTGKNAN